MIFIIKTYITLEWKKSYKLNARIGANACQLIKHLKLNDESTSRTNELKNQCSNTQSKSEK